MFFEGLSPDIEIHIGTGGYALVLTEDVEGQEPDAQLHIFTDETQMLKLVKGFIKRRQAQDHSATEKHMAKKKP